MCTAYTPYSSFVRAFHNVRTSVLRAFQNVRSTLGKDRVQSPHTRGEGEWNPAFPERSREYQGVVLDCSTAHNVPYSLGHSVAVHGTMFTCVHTYAHTLRKNMNTHARARTHTHTGACMHATHILTAPYICMYTDRRPHTHTHTHAHTHTHTHTQTDYIRICVCCACVLFIGSKHLSSQPHGRRKRFQLHG